MNTMTRITEPVPVLPDTAPFSDAQRSWLNGFFAGLVGFDAGAPPPRTLPAPPAPPEGDDAPWHDPAMAIDDRLHLAAGRPLPRRLMAAMAQQDCGQCGYLCDSYALALAEGRETKRNLCQPGGKDTLRAVKKLLEAEAPTVPDAAPQSAGADKPAAAAGAVPASVAPADAIRPGTSRNHPVEVEFRSATRLNGPGSDKQTLHVVWSLPEGLNYQPGDSFGVFARNDPALADAIIEQLQAPAGFPIADKTLRQALIEDYALGPAPDMLFQLVSYVTGGDKRRQARELALGGDPFGDAAIMDVLQALTHFPGLRVDPEAFVECLEPLQPRLYSISSSPLTRARELTLTVDVVRYKAGGRTRLGVASTDLADRLRPGDRVQAYVAPAHGFALPADPATPIIMVGPGTGVAPFRAFLEHRAALAAPGPAWLFYGHRSEAADFLYRDEFERFQHSGALTRLSTAWSRDGAAKIYVQDRMAEAGAELFAWLEAGAHFYVCGDAKRMAADVDKALHGLIERHGARSADAAKAFVKQLAAAGRYQRDVY